VSQVRRTEPEAKVYREIKDRKALRDHLQWALCVEISTIPPYLCALYSIVDRSTDAAALVRSVVLEEMLHAALVSNLLNAIGGTPSLAPHLVPRYPGYIPHHAAGGPYIQLQALSPTLAETVFMAIEQPEPSPHAPPEGNRFHTIGQFYKAIEKGFVNCAERYPDLFAHTGVQQSDTYFGAGGGKLVVVDSLDAAGKAIREITEQGEGATHPHPPVPGAERFSDLDHYGTRLDGTYGPIVGTPWELSHYFKFRQLARGEVPVPATYPMQPNPSSDEFDGDVRALAELFDGCYTLVLRALERSFSSPDGAASFFGTAFPVMQSVLPQLATLLMTTPVETGGDPELGPTAGPGFAYREQPVDALVHESRWLLERAPDYGTDYIQAWDATLSSTADVLEELTAAPEPVR
jgi:hypothetical protein